MQVPGGEIPEKKSAGATVSVLSVGLPGGGDTNSIQQ